MCRPLLLSVSVLLLIAPATRAGLYYSGETYAALPSQWRGFLLDQRTLRNIAVKPAAGQEPSPWRTRYLDDAERLQKKAKLTADEWADLGALYVRLGEPARAVEVLRAAQRDHPNHFAIAANLGTALQLTGELAQATLALDRAVRLAPGKQLAAEEAHLKLVRDRLKKGPRSTALDDLFGVRYVGDKGEFEPGKLADAERKKLPAKAVPVAQQLALWLPADGRLLWQLGELASAHGDVKSAAAMTEGCVVQYSMDNAELRKHRRALREAVERQAKEPPTKEGHEKHAAALAFRSSRPLVGRIDLAALPPVSETGVNPLPWELFGETTIGKPFRPAFPKYLHELEGKKVSLTGFMYPLRDDPQAGAFLFIENPVGCWYCEMPETTGILYVELPQGRTTALQRGLVRVTGRLTLNRNDPEDFLYALRDAAVGGVD